MQPTDINLITDSVANLKPPALLLAALYVVGIIMKAVPRIPNWTIPIAVCLLGAFCFPYMGEASPYVKAAQVPYLAMMLIGFLIGAVAVGIKQVFKQTIIRDNEPEPAKPGKIPSVLFCLPLIGALLFGAGCQSTLEQGGAYAPVALTTNAEGQVSTLAVIAPDKAFYAVEGTFLTTYAMLDAVFKFEKDNRTMLWAISRDIKHTLDKLRTEADAVVLQYGKARAAYLANPTPAGLTAMNTAIAKTKQLAAAASAAIPQQ